MWSLGFFSFFFLGSVWGVWFARGRGWALFFFSPWLKSLEEYLNSGRTVLLHWQSELRVLLGVVVEADFLTKEGAYCLHFVMATSLSYLFVLV